MVRDMTRGNPLKLILLFCAPLMVGSLFQQFYNMADTIIVGRFVGVTALAGVGSTGSLNFLVIGFVQGICSGFSIPVAQFFGAGDHTNMRRCVANAVYLAGGVTMAITAATLLLTGPVLRLMQTPADIYPDAHAYIFIIFAGIPATMLYNLLSSILRALGDSKTPLYFLLFSSAVNIGLDFFFILVLGMGVEGAAYATVISQGVSGILCFFYILRRFPILRLAREEWEFSGKKMARLLAIGLPMALQFSITAVGSAILQTAVNTLGSATVAAVTAASKVQMAICMPMESLGLTLATFCGQNLGAMRVDRVREGIRRGTVVVLVYCAAAMLLSYYAGTSMALLFLDSAETAILSQVSQFLLINSLFYPALGVLFVYRNSLQGLGFSLPAMMAGVFELLARSLVAMSMVSVFGYAAVCYASPAAWVAADLLLLPVYFWGIKRLWVQYPPPAPQPQQEAA